MNNCGLTTVACVLCSFYTAVCSPLCENGGACIGPGVCNCTSEWTGDRCQNGQHTIVVSTRLCYVFINNNHSQLSAVRHANMEGTALLQIVVHAQVAGLETCVK